MIGDNIKKIRESKSIGVNELARIANVNASYISAIERNEKNNPSIKILNKIASSLGVSMDDFFKEVQAKETVISNAKKTVPTEFINANEARAYVNMHQIFGAHGFNANKLDDNEILEFANELLKQMEMVSFKYKK
jgi:transcriptional regulator with XRE-family HTH domain